MSTQLRESLAAGVVFAEAQIDRTERLLRNVTLLGRVSANGRRYSEQAMQDAARLYEGTKVFLDHPTRRELQERDGKRSVRDLCGKILRARVAGDHVRGDVQLLSGPDGDRVLALAEEMPDAVGHSHRAVGEVARSRGGITEVESLTQVFAVELVTEPATTAGLFEHREETDVKREPTGAELAEQWGERLFNPPPRAHRKPKPTPKPRREPPKEISREDVAKWARRIVV